MLRRSPGCGVACEVAVNGVIAVLPQPSGHYPLWQWLPSRRLSLVTGAESGPVPVPHEAPDAQERAASLSRILARWCERTRPERIVHLDAADAQVVAVMRARYDIPGQLVFSAVLYNDRLALRERLQSAEVPVLPYAALGRVADLRAFADAYGLPVRVRSRWVDARQQDVVLSDPAQLRAFAQGLYRDAPNVWIVEPAPAARELRIDALHRDGGLELVWIAESNLVRDTPGRRTVLALERDDPRAHRARDLLDAALSELPDPDIALVHATLRENADCTLAVADLGLGIDPGYPRSLIRAALGTDPVRDYVQAAAGLPLPASVRRPARVTGRVEVLADGPGVLTALGALPGELAGPRTALPEVGQHLEPGEPAARFEAMGPDRAAVRAELDRFAAWFTGAAQLQPSPAAV